MAKVVFDENKLTLGDLEDFEDYVGKRLDEALKKVPVRDEVTGEIVKDEKGRPVTTVEVSTKVLTAMTWISRRHENPDYTVEDARKERITDLDIVEDNGSEGDASDPKDSDD